MKKFGSNKLVIVGLAVVMIVSLCIFCVSCNKANIGGEHNIKQGSVSCLVIGVDGSGKRIDSLNVASVNYTEKTLSVLSVPCDIRCIKEKYSKEITDDNLEKIVDEISVITNIDITRYIVLDFESVLSVFSELSDVTFDIPDIYGDGVGMVYDDDSQDLHISLAPGQHRLTPEEMLHVIRYIKGNVNDDLGTASTYENKELDRIQMQQRLISAIFDQKIRNINGTAILSIIKGFPSKLKTNLKADEIVDIYKLITSLDVDNIILKTMDGQYITEGDIRYFEPVK